MIIGFTGKARSGKDTAADYLANRFGFHKYAFADPIKQTINPLFGWDANTEKDVVDPKWGISPRFAYQNFGTEFCRESLREDFFLIKADEVVTRYMHTVIPDVRFENEAEYVRMGGCLIHIIRPGVRDVEAHKSEDGVSRKPYDIAIVNDGSVLDFQMRILKMLTRADIIPTSYQYDDSQNVTY